MAASASRPAMIGRDADMARLHALLDEALECVPRAVVIGGEAGIGKTRLLREFTAEADPEALLLTGQCVDLDAAGAPYAPIVSVLRGLTAAIGIDTVASIVGPGRSALAALLPELAPQTPTAPDSSQEQSATAESFSPAVPASPATINHLHEAVAVLLEACSRDRALLIVIEDLHWIDGASLNLLRFLLRALNTGCLMFLLSYRSDDVGRGHPVRGFLTELERARLVTRWQLSRLTRVQVRHQAKQILGAAPSAEQLASVFERSDGVPFFVEELLGACETPGSDELPETLRDILLARYERLSDPAQRLLRLLSAGGVRVTHPLLEAVSDAAQFGSSATDDAELDEAAREAVRATLLIADDDSYQFRHALVREAIHNDLLPGERGRFHTRYAQALEAGVQPGRVTAEISYHWARAHDTRRAFTASLAAMREAKSAYAYSTAAQMGERALELWDQLPDAEQLAGLTKVDLLGKTAATLRTAGDSERALAFVKQALDECPPEKLRERARLLGDKAQYYVGLGRPGTIALLTEALETIPSDDQTALRATLMASLAGRYMIEARMSDGLVLAEQAFAEAQRAGSILQQSIAANVWGGMLVHSGHVDAGLAKLDEAMQLAATQPDAELRYRVNASDARYLLGHYEKALRIAEEGRARARELGIERSYGVILASNMVDPLLAIGQWERASTIIDASLALDPPLAFRRYLQRARMWLALWRGDADGAYSALTALRPLLGDIIDAEQQTRLGMARVAAETAVARGAFAEAWHEAGTIVLSNAPRLPAYDLPLVAVAARALHVLQGDPGQAALLGAVDAPIAGAEAQLRAVLAYGAFWPTAPVWAALCEAELADDSPSWRTAVAASDSQLAPIHLRSYTRVRLAEALFSEGDRTDARAVLAEAEARVEATGIGLMAREISAIRQRSGLTLADDGEQAQSGRVANTVGVQDAAPQLTARETQVLDLVAQGLSNKQIGERLFISAKTASVHVSAILRKLGATTRTEAAFLATAPAMAHSTRAGAS